MVMPHTADRCGENNESETERAAIGRRSYLKLAGVAAGSVPLFAGKGAAATERHGIRFRTVVDMVAAGGDATAQEQEAQESTSGSSAFLGPLLVSAARTADVPVEEMLGPKGRRLLPHLEERCIAELFAADSFGGLDPGELLAPGADPGRLRRTVGTNDAAEVHPQVPVLLLQGGADTTVPQLLSDRLAGQYRDRGTDLEYVVLPDADHISLLPDGASRVHAWVAEAFAG